MGHAIELELGTEDIDRVKITAADFEILKIEMRQRCASVWASRFLTAAAKRPVDDAGQASKTRELASLERLKPLFLPESSSIPRPRVNRILAMLALAFGLSWMSNLADAETDRFGARSFVYEPADGLLAEPEQEGARA